MSEKMFPNENGKINPFKRYGLILILAIASWALFLSVEKVDRDHEANSEIAWAKEASLDRNKLDYEQRRSGLITYATYEKQAIKENTKLKKVAKIVWLFLIAVMLAEIAIYLLTRFDLTLKGTLDYEGNHSPPLENVRAWHIDRANRVAKLVGMIFIGVCILVSSVGAKELSTSATGVNAIKHFEGFRANAYYDAVGVKTIGYGTTENVEIGQKITRLQARMMLAKDLYRFEKYLNHRVVRERRGWIEQNQFDALVSFVYNIGSLYGNLYRVVRVGDKAKIAYWMNKYIKAGGRTLPGLVKRRKIESEIYLGNCEVIQRFNPLACR